jgi:hypothetical protein
MLGLLISLFYRRGTLVPINPTSVPLFQKASSSNLFGVVAAI